MSKKTGAEILRNIVKSLLTGESTLPLMLRGYKLTYGGAKPPWRGYPEARKHMPLIAEFDEKKFYVTKTTNHEGIDEIIQKQSQLPHMARIERRIGSLLLTELVSGWNLWELDESGRPLVQEVERALNQFVDALEKASIVHADLRPWNVLYSPGDQRFAVIDWGHCYQAPGDPPPCYKHLKASGHAPPYENIDYCDVERLIAALQDPERVDGLWNMKRSPTWFPEKWVM